MNRQRAKDTNYTSAMIAGNAIADAHGEIWAATADYVEYNPPGGYQHISRAIRLLEKALEECRTIAIIIEGGKV